MSAHPTWLALTAFDRLTVASFEFWCGYDDTEALTADAQLCAPGDVCALVVRLERDMKRNTASSSESMLRSSSSAKQARTGIESPTLRFGDSSTSCAPRGYATLPPVSHCPLNYPRSGINDTHEQRGRSPKL